MNPQTVNAYNGGLENKIVFPAGILQPPYLRAESVDDAVNYGAIGAVIGHEISHGFDDQGRKIDADRRGARLVDRRGRRRASRREATKPSARSMRPIEAASRCSYINPDLTMGENIADLAGLDVAHRRLSSLAGRKGSAGDRRADRRPALLPRLCPGVARARRARIRIKQQVASDPHSPARWRIIGPAAQRRCVVQGVQSFPRAPNII